MTGFEIVAPRPHDERAASHRVLLEAKTPEAVEMRGVWYNAIIGLLPPHAHADGSMAEGVRWSNANGLWTLVANWREQRPVVLSTGWREPGHPGQEAWGSRWFLLDHTPEYVRSFLACVGAIELP